MGIGIKSASMNQPQRKLLQTEIKATNNGEEKPKRKNETKEKEGQKDE
jgi:hypothetical protein